MTKTINYTQKNISYTHMLLPVMDTLRNMAFGKASASECANFVLDAIACASNTDKKQWFVNKIISKKTDADGKDIYFLCNNAINKAKNTIVPVRSRRG